MLLILFSLMILVFSHNCLACPDVNGLLDVNCDKKVKILAFGDSITFGIQDATGLGYPGRLQLLFPDVEIVNLGIPGESTPDGGSRAITEFASNADADFVIILEGANDYWLRTLQASETRDNLLRMKNLALALKFIPLLGKLTHVLRDEQKPWINRVNRALGSNAELDFFSLGSGIISGDHLHPTGSGYQLMAELIASHLLSATAANRPADNDHDGVYDKFEAKYGADPLLFDTDGDGLSDGEEIFTYGSNPALLDSDGDGFTDPFEVNQLGSDPADPRPSPPKLKTLEVY